MNLQEALSVSKELRSSAPWKPAAEPVRLSRPRMQGWDDYAGRALSSREGELAVLSDGPLSFFGSARLEDEAYQLAGHAYPGEEREALALAAYYSGLSRDKAEPLTLGQAFAELPALMEYHGDGASPKEAYEAVRARARERRGMGPENQFDRHGNRMEQFGAALGLGLQKVAQMGAMGTLFLAESAMWTAYAQGWTSRETVDAVADYRNQSNDNFRWWESPMLEKAMPQGGLFESDGALDFALNLGAFLVSEAPRQAVQLAALAALGPVGGAAYIGLDSAYQKNSDLALDHPEMSEESRHLNAVLTGLINSGGGQLSHYDINI